MKEKVQFLYITKGEDKYLKHSKRFVMICVSSLGSPKQLCEEFETAPQGTS